MQNQSLYWPTEPVENSSINMLEWPLDDTPFCDAVDWYILPPICGVGFLMNCLILVIVLQKNIRETNIGLYMAILGVVDNLTLLRFVFQANTCNRYSTDSGLDNAKCKLGRFL